MKLKEMTLEEKRAYQREKMQRWRLRHPDRVKEQNRKARAKPTYKEKHRLEMKEWRKNNPEGVKAVRKRNYLLHGKEYNEKRRLRYKTDAEYRAKKQLTDKKYNSSGKRKIAIDRNPNKHENLKRKWIKIKNGDYAKVREKHRRYRAQVYIHKEREERKNLDDSYVISIIKQHCKYQIKTKDIPPELIEAKRNIIKLKRINKEHDTRANL